MQKLTRRHKLYPKLLGEIYRPPTPLYLQGEIPAPPAIAVVGTRRPSNYGQQAAELLVARLIKANLTIISGLAVGIDTIAHKTALQAGGSTVAVIAGGFNHIYPAQNLSLAKEITLISEHPPHIKPLRQYFPARNRIISGLSLGTVIIEAGEKSGALITARFALEQNREVFALPGSIFSPNSQGTNRLIQQGAKLITNAQDILDELNLKHTIKLFEEPITPDNPQEAKILNILSRESMHIDDIIRKTRMTTTEINSCLTLMELNGKIKNLGAKNYVIGK